MIEAIAQLIKRRSPAQDAGSSCSNRGVPLSFSLFFITMIIFFKEIIIFSPEISGRRFRF